MRFNILIIAMAVFVLSFASAQVIVPGAQVLDEEILVSAVTPGSAPVLVPPVQIAPSIDITPISPANNYEVYTSSDVKIDFSFLINPYGLLDLSYPISCKVLLTSNSGDAVELDAVLNEATNVGSVDYRLSKGEYQWNVECEPSNNNFGRTWSSSTMSFSVKESSNGGSSGGASSSGGSSSGNGNSNDGSAVDDERGKRRPGADNNLPLTNLSTTNTNTNNQKNNGFSGITGAVVGVLGEKGALWFGVFLVIVGIAGLFIYNRARFGIVKAK